MTRTFRHYAAVWLVLVCLTGLTQSQIGPSPQGPTLAPPFPLGVQRGVTTDLTLTGTNLLDPIGVITSFPAKVVIPTENNNGKDPTKLLVRLEVSKDAPLGLHTIRVSTRSGVSNFRLFCVDDLPQIVENDKNGTRTTAQDISIPSVVCGRVDAATADFFKFKATAGQRVQFEVLGRRLGSQLDPILVISDTMGRQVASNDDAPGLNKDPRISHTFKDAGEYVIEIRDVRFAGGADNFYRLRIGDFPLATTSFPLAAQRGSTVKVEF